MTTTDRFATMIPPDNFQPFTLPDAGKPARDRADYAESYPLSTGEQYAGNVEKGEPS